MEERRQEGEHEADARRAAEGSTGLRLPERQAEDEEGTRGGEEEANEGSEHEDVLCRKKRRARRPAVFAVGTVARYASEVSASRPFLLRYGKSRRRSSAT